MINMPEDCEFYGGFYLPEVEIPEDLAANYTFCMPYLWIEDPLVRRCLGIGNLIRLGTDHTMSQIFSEYVINQDSHATQLNRHVIKVLNCQFDDHSQLALWTINRLDFIAGLARYGYVEHHTVSSIEEVNDQIRSHNQNVGAIVIRGHGDCSLMEIDGGHICLSRDQSFSACELTREHNRGLKLIVLYGCYTGQVTICQVGDRRPVGMALDLAHHYPGVAVTGANSAVYRQTMCYHFYSAERGLGVELVEVGSIDADYHIVNPEDPHLWWRERGTLLSQTFCVNPTKDYRSVTALKLAADQLSQGQYEGALSAVKQLTDQHECSTEQLQDLYLCRPSEFVHLLKHTKLTFQELQEVYRYCEEQHYIQAIRLFKEALFYPSFARLIEREQLLVSRAI